MTAVLELPVSARYRLVPTRSTAKFRVMELGLFPVSGEFTVTAGEVTVEDGTALVHAELDATSFRSGNTKRDKDICSRRFLDTDTYPTLAFDGSLVDGRVSGTLTVHGQSVPTDLAITVVHQETERIEVRATTRLDRTAAGVTRGRGIIARMIDINLTVTLIPT
jgi:polyisoprenoid-binding protein YceI